MTSTLSYTIEHFYFGQTVQGGHGVGNLRVLASSTGVSPEMAIEAVQHGRIPPLPNSPVGAWALVRGGQSTPFILVQAAVGAGGQPLRHFMLLPVDLLRALGGNLRALRGLLHPQMPIFEAAGRAIPTINVGRVTPLPPDAQESAMLALLNIAQDRLDSIDALLAAIIQDMPVIVYGAPPDLDQRTAFVEGLLALLPTPARYGVTFATHFSPATPVNAQIIFLGASDPLPSEGLIFHWLDGRVTGARPENDYSRYIKSQLRLDTRMVVEATQALTPVAGWRIKQGDTLAEALAYAAHRLRLDDAVLNNQPVEAHEVSRVLAEDPTLTDELRAAYIRHLLAFALALDDISAADIFAAAARDDQTMERLIIDELDGAIAAGKALRVFERVRRWLNENLGIKGMYWLGLLHRAALAHVNQLVRTQDADNLRSFLLELEEAPITLDLHAIIPDAVEQAVTVCAGNPELCKVIFLLAAIHLPNDRWQRMLGVRPLMAQLPPGVAHVFGYINGDLREHPPLGLLLQVLSDFDEPYRPALLIRLAETTVLAGRFDLVDAEALRGLAAAAQMPWGEAFDGTLRWMVRSLSSDDVLPSIPVEGRRHLLQILLARRAYNELVTELMHHNRLFYPTEKQIHFAVLVRQMFIETYVPQDEISAVLNTMTVRGVKPLPLAMAYFGLLEQYRWAPALEVQAAELTSLVFSNRLIVEAIQPDLLIDLLNFHVERRDATLATRIAALLPAAAARRGEAGVAVMIQMYKMLDWDEIVRAAALDGLRRFVRRCSDSFAPLAVARFGRELGDRVREALDATLLLWRMLSGEGIADYAYSLHTVAQFLYDTTIVYLDKNRIPSLGILQNDLDSLSGGLAEDERQQLPAAILELGRLIVAVAVQHRQARPRENDEHVDALVSGRGVAVSVLDVFRAMGGYFARGRRFSVRGDRVLTEHPLADRAAHILFREVQQINRLLRTALDVVPRERKLNISAAAIYGEVESLWEDVSLHERRQLVRNLAVDLQRIPELVLLITDRSDPRVLQEENGLGRKLDQNRQRPENTLEFYRFLHGYFKARS